MAPAVEGEIIQEGTLEIVKPPQGYNCPSSSQVHDWQVISKLIRLNISVSYIPITQLALPTTPKALHGVIITENST